MKKLFITRARFPNANDEHVYLLINQQVKPTVFSTFTEKELSEVFGDSVRETANYLKLGESVEVFLSMKFKRETKGNEPLLDLIRKKAEEAATKSRLEVNGSPENCYAGGISDALRAVDEAIIENNFSALKELKP